MKKILISIAAWETRASIVRNNKLQNVFFSSNSTKSLEKCFFKGIVTKILPGIQTAFVDIGQEKSGFLHISEIDRDLAIGRMSETVAMEEPEAKEPVKKMETSFLLIKKVGPVKRGVFMAIHYGTPFGHG